ncbi:phosphoribosylglycinamide formyltransferase [Ventosimonas gracilis]|uniref:Phosphoribosylglycinamide formyltransferase n=1 Tax=Ventosimonas gracilis TaxID=1680762 RepID=A0A139SS19_9GAMM|nr:phosphoribosylglycinamide formyltransferase [Ventosimonas gracilis]KXU37241.1 phosphoribosylglycinamide formyltransferase [Ventosimonas gracilis]
MTCRVVVLISGNGSNLQALMDDCQKPQSPAQIVAVLANRRDAGGLERARVAGIANEWVDHSAFAERETFENALRGRIDNHSPDLLVLAGFMRVLTADFVRHYQGRLLNIHPSLLPAYKGLHTHQRVLEAGDSEHGCSVHFVSEALDGGPLIAQAKVPVEAGDTAEVLAARVLRQEHRIYPQVVRWFAEGRLKLDGQQVLLDGEVLPPQGRVL